MVRLDNGGFLANPDKGVRHAFQFNPDDIERLSKFPEIAEMFKNAMSEVYSADQYGTEAWEYHLFAGPWGFNVADIPMKVLVFHGECDKMCVFSMGKLLAKRLFLFPVSKIL